MVYRKEATGVVCAVAAAMFLSACWNADKWGSQRSVFTNDAVKREITKVDYTPTQTWFALSPFNGSGSEFSFSGETLYSKGKTLTWSLVVETSRLIRSEDGHYLWEIPASWSKVTGMSDTALDEPKRIAKLTFVKWLTKMALVWERYAYEEKNLRPGDDYRFKIFKTGDEYYVLEFENKTESKRRDEKYGEFEREAKELNLKYMRSPEILNTELEKLRLEYWIDVRKFQ